MKQLRILALLLALLLAVSLVACDKTPEDDEPQNTEEPDPTEEPVQVGSIAGTGLTWEFYANGELQIKGEGAMPADLIDSADYGANKQPWGSYATGNNDYRLTIKRVVVEEGVTGLSQMSFKGCTSLETVLFKGSALTEIPFDCFNGCTALRRVTAKGVTVIGDNAFQGCKMLTGLTMSALVLSVSDGAFHGACESGLTLTLFGTEEEWQAAREGLQIADPDFANKPFADATSAPKFTKG